MLDSMGIKSMEDLFSDIPEGVRRVDSLPFENLNPRKNGLMRNIY